MENPLGNHQHPKKRRKIMKKPTSPSRNHPNHKKSDPLRPKEHLSEIMKIIKHRIRNQQNHENEGVAWGHLASLGGTWGSLWAWTAKTQLFLWLFNRFLVRDPDQGAVTPSSLGAQGGVGEGSPPFGIRGLGIGTGVGSGSVALSIYA